MRRPPDLTEHEILLQVDGDGSHGHLKHGLAQATRDVETFQLLLPPPLSPDLDSIEARWNIKLRAHKRSQRFLTELKTILRDVWAKLTLKGTRDRISELPDRCQ